MSMILEPEKIRNILVVAITRMGDMIQASPTLVGLKKEYPNARITVLIEKQFAAICDGIPSIDDLVVIDLAYVCRCLAREQDGVIDAFRYVTEQVEVLREKNFDFSLNMSSSPYTALLLKMLGIQDCRGWVSDEEGHRLIRSPWAMLFSAFVYHSNRDYNSLNLVDIFRCAAGVRKHPRHLIFELHDEGRAFAKEYLENCGVTGRGPLICLQAGASQVKRQWAKERFAELTRQLIAELDARIVFVGSNSELRIIEPIVEMVQHSNAVIAAGKTNFQQLAGLLEQADVMITGDTGPMHLAVAVGTPVVALFLASALCFETGPYGAGNIVIQPQITCNPCNPNFPCSRPDCHDQITPSLVTYLTKLRLQNPSPTLEGVSIPSSIVHPDAATIFVTEFDPEGFLNFRQLSGIGHRHGRDVSYFLAARSAYRDLWKEQFDFMTPGAAVQVSANNKIPDFVRDGILQLEARIAEAILAIQRLIELIEDASSPPRMLGEVNRLIGENDKNIETIGLSFPILGAMVRLFVMEKENMRGENPLLLASEMKQLYRALGARAKRFGELYGHYARQYPNLREPGRDDVLPNKEHLYNLPMGVEHR